MKPSLDIVIVNWNSGRYLRHCLKSIPGAVDDSFALNRVVVIDNDSSDGSAIDLVVPDLPLHLIQNPENRGFSVACNQGAKGSVADYVLFLNPDTVLHSDSLYLPLAFMEKPENARVGICGIQLVDELGHVARTCSPFPRPGVLVARMLGLHEVFPRIFPPQFQTESELRFNQAVDQVIGAFLVIRRRLFEALCGFDERFFVYFDDVDLCLRCSQTGYTSFFLQEATASHAENKCSENVRAMAIFYYVRSRLQYSWKHFSATGAAGVLAGTVFIEPVTRAVRDVARWSWKDLCEGISAYVKLWSWFLSTTKRRQQGVPPTRQLARTESKGD